MANSPYIPMIAEVPQTGAKITVHFTKEGRAELSPEPGFDLNDPSNREALSDLAILCQQRALEPTVKAAVIAVPHGQAQAEQGTQPATDAPQLVDKKTFDAMAQQVQQLQQQLQQLQQAMGAQAAPAAPAGSPPQPQPAAPAPAPQAQPQPAPSSGQTAPPPASALAS